MQIVAVVPYDSQAKVIHRHERRRARTEHRSNAAATYCQPSPVTLGWAQIGGEHDVVVLADCLDQGSIRELEVTRVGQDGQRTATGRQRRSQQPSQQIRPVGGRSGVPHGSWRPPRGQGGEEGPTIDVLGPATWLRRGGSPGGLRRRLLPFDRRMPRRDCQPQHVSRGAGVAIGDSSRQRGDLWGQHRLRRPDPAQPC